jgi:hypothetical protein
MESGTATGGSTRTATSGAAIALIDCDADMTADILWVPFAALLVPAAAIAKLASP